MINKYDELLKTANWLEETDLPVAIVLRETLESVEGDDAIIFPPTFAKGDTAPHPYQISELRREGALSTSEGKSFNTCDLDTVGSQGNRMEEVFAESEFSSLVPKTIVTANGKDANLVKVGHRIADAVVRFSDKTELIQEAIQKLKTENDATAIAKFAPTSLLFGFWDSHDSGFKAGRILSSTIRANNVSVISRSGQYKTPFNPDELDLNLPDKVKPSQIGLDGVPFPGNKKNAKGVIRINGEVVGAHGGVIVDGEIVRRTQINLVNLRALEAKGEPKETIEERTMQLRRYLFGLALVAGRAQKHYALRQGCHLVLKGKPQIEIIYADGKRDSQIKIDENYQEFDWRLSDAKKFAEKAKEQFGIGEDLTITFDKTKAKKAKPEDE